MQVEFAADQIAAEWLDDLLVGARDSHRVFERSQSELEDAHTKYLGLKKVGGRAGGQRLQQRSGQAHAARHVSQGGA